MKRLLSPLDVQIELTEACNQICRHCYNYWRQSRKPVGDELTMKQFLNIAKQIFSAKVGSVTLTGGEPMLRKNVLFAIISKLHGFGIDTGMNSNGVLIDKTSAKTLAECGLDHALISLLGPEKIHNQIVGQGGNFKKTTRGIENLLNAGIKISVNMPASKINLHYVFDTAKIVKDLGVKSFCSGAIVPSCKSAIPTCLSAEEFKGCLRDLIRINTELGLKVDVLETVVRCMFDPKEEQEFVRFIGKGYCLAAISTCAISSKGDMRPCVQSDVIYGNVLPDKFLDVWAKMRPWSSPKMLPKKCLGCNSIKICEGGCRVSAKNTTGSYCGQDMYMTEPITDPERVLLFPSEKDTKCKFGLNDLFVFNERCIIRKEKGGYVAFVGNSLEYITQSGFDFLAHLRQVKTFSIASLVKETGHAGVDLKYVLQEFLKSGIIERRVN